jgi:hypothetical protein
MPVFTAIFSKSVSNDTGHERKVCQQVIEVEADNRSLALASAKERFCVLQLIPDWSLHADEISLSQSPKSQA